MRGRTHRDVFTLVFTAAVFTVAKAWKQPKRPLMDMDKQSVAYPYIGIKIEFKGVPLN